MNMGNVFIGKLTQKKESQLPSPEYSGQPLKKKKKSTNLIQSHFLSVGRCRKQQLLVLFRYHKLSINYALLVIYGFGEKNRP